MQLPRCKHEPANPTQNDRSSESFRLSSSKKTDGSNNQTTGPRPKKPADGQEKELESEVPVFAWQTVDRNLLRHLYKSAFHYAKQATTNPPKDDDYNAFLTI